MLKFCLPMQSNFSLGEYGIYEKLLQEVERSKIQAMHKIFKTNHFTVKTKNTKKCKDKNKTNKRK